MQPTAEIPAPGEAVAAAFFEPSYQYFGIDFSNRQSRVNLHITPPDKKVNRGKTIKVSFLPGNSCYFGDKKACTSAHHNGLNNMVFLTIHSGVGGEGQDLRHALEGTGLNRAGYSLEKVQKNMAGLAAAEVAIIQNGQKVDGFTLVGVTRIPAKHVKQYLGLHIQDALLFATQLDAKLMTAIDPTRPMLVFETCGWKMSGERWYPGTSATTGSIYVGVIQNLP